MQAYKIFLVVKRSWNFFFNFRFNLNVLALISQQLNTHATPFNTLKKPKVFSVNTLFATQNGCKTTNNGVVTMGVITLQHLNPTHFAPFF